MATLTETAIIARKGIKYGSMGFVGLVVLWFVTTGFISWWKATHPEPPPPPTVDFGRLPNLVFTEESKPVESWDLQTPTGKLGAYPDRMLVFFAPSARSGFSDAAAAIERARRMNFLNEPTKVSPTLYRWTSTTPLPTELQIDIVTGGFLLKRQWQADPSLLVNKRFVNDQQVIGKAAAFLRGIGALNNDILGNEEVTYWRAQGSTLVPTIALSEADFVKVEFYRNDYQVIDEETKEVLATYGFQRPNPNQGLVSVMVSGIDDPAKSVIEVEYNYLAVDYQTTGEYPIKSVEQAWEELQSGGGYVASYSGSGTGVVRRISLGYYDWMPNQRYEMPIFIFTGDDELAAYVSAVTPSVLEQQ